MKSMKLGKRIESVIDEPSEHDLEQFGLYLFNSRTYRLLWLDGYLFCFDDQESWFLDIDRREVVPIFFIGNCHFLRIDYKKFCLMDQNNGNLKFKNDAVAEPNDIIFPIIKADNYIGRLVVDAIKKYED